MFANDHPTRRTTILSTLLILAAAAVPLILLGRLTAPNDPPMRLEAGVPVGFARTEVGAQAAGKAFAAARARAILLRPERRRALLDAIATSRFATAADREDDQRDLAPLSGQEAGRYLVTPLSTYLAAYDDEGRARLMVWLFQVWAADAAVGSFSTQAVDLVWRDGRWRLDGQTDAPVQAVPEVTQKPRHGDTRRLMRERDHQTDQQRGQRTTPDPDPGFF